MAAGFIISLPARFFLCLWFIVFIPSLFTADFVSPFLSFASFAVINRPFPFDLIVPQYSVFFSQRYLGRGILLYQLSATRGLPSFSSGSAKLTTMDPDVPSHVL